MPLESAVERALVREAQARGVLAPKLVVPGQAGWPDRLLLGSAGRAAFCELKRPGETPRPLQLRIHRKLHRLGFRVGVVDESAAVAAFLDEWLRSYS